MSTDKYKGVVEIEILGKKRGFKTGTRAAILFCEQEKISINDLEAHLDNGGLTAQLKFIYCTALAYSKLMKEEEPSFDEVCAWVDEFGNEKLQGELAKSSEIPNSPALETGPEKV